MRNLNTNQPASKQSTTCKDGSSLTVGIYRTLLCCCCWTSVPSLCLSFFHWYLSGASLCNSEKFNPIQSIMWVSHKCSFFCLHCAFDESTVMHACSIAYMSEQLPTFNMSTTELITFNYVHDKSFTFQTAPTASSVIFCHLWCLFVRPSPFHILILRRNTWIILSYHHHNQTPSAFYGN